MGERAFEKILESVLQTGLIEFREHGRILEGNKASPPPGKPQRSTHARNVNVFISYGELKTPLSILSCLFYVEIVM